MRVSAEKLVDDDVNQKMINLADRLIEEMKPQLDEWLNLQVSPTDALNEAMRHIQVALRHPALARARNYATAQEYVELKLRFYLKII